MVLLVCSGMDGPDIKYSFLVRVIKTLIGKRKCAQDYEENSNPKIRFHGDRFGVIPSVSCL